MIAMIRITGLPAPKSQLVTPVIRRMVSVTEIKSRTTAIARKVLGVIFLCSPEIDLHDGEIPGNASFEISACQLFGLLVLYFARFFMMLYANSQRQTATTLIEACAN